MSPSAESRGAVVSYWRKYVHKVLVNRVEGLSLPRKSVVRLTDYPDMTLDVYCGRKTTMQQQQPQNFNTDLSYTFSSNFHQALLRIISIFSGCMVWIEKSVTRVTDRHHEACRVMPNSDPE